MAGIADVAKKAGIDAKGAREVLDAIKQLAESGEKVVVQGYGTFECKTRAARTANNMITGEKINVPEKRVFVFKASKPGKK